MIQNDYSAEEEYEISLQLLGQHYNEALDKIDSLNAIISDLLNIMHMYGIPVPQKIQEQLDLDLPFPHTLTDTSAFSLRQNTPSILDFCDKMHRLFPDKIGRL